MQCYQNQRIKELDVQFQISNLSILTKKRHQYITIPWAFLAISLFALCLLAGCSANYKSIFRHELVTDSSSVTTVDAKQRAILSNSLSTSRGNNTSESIRRFCSEPSPDVYSVIAQALSAGGTLSKSADPKSVEAILELAFSDSEQASTIPRTQTINMLRELMFRTCERYLNGAYTDLEMSVQAVRDQRLMVSILAIEQLTGAVTPKPVVIGATGASSAGASGEAIVRVDDALKAMKSAEQSHAKAEEAFNELNKNNTCDEIVEAVEKGDDLTDDQKNKQKQCDDARTAVASAKSRLVETTNHYTDLKRLVSTSEISSSTALTSAATGGFDRAHEGAVSDVADIVYKIVERNFNNDTETLLFCYKALTDTELVDKLEATALGPLRATCLEYLNKRVAVEKHRLIKEIEEYKAATEKINKHDKEDFERQWPQLKKYNDDDDKKEKFIQVLRKETLGPEIADCFDEANEKQAYFECFKYLRPELKRKLPEVE